LWSGVRPSTVDIPAPEFPERTEWLNVPFLRMSTLMGRNVALVWFWDCSSLNSLRALPYLKEWHRRYERSGLKAIGVHSPQFDFGRERAVVDGAVQKYDIEFAVALDPEYEIWRLYGNEVWPALYLWDRRGVLRYYHFGEGAYQEAESAIGELLLEIDDQVELPEPMAPLRNTDRDGALVQVPTPHHYLEDDRSGRAIAPGEELAVRYEGASAAAVLDGEGDLELELDGKPLRTISLNGPGLYTLVDSPVHEQHELRLRFRDEARAYVFSFAPGIA
jgi:hypothetical protein